MTLLPRLLLTALLLASAVPSTAQAGDVEFSFTIQADSTPDLVFVDPGVYAVVGHPYPVLLADGHYWAFHQNRWWRAERRGVRWAPVGVRVVPARVRATSYTRYVDFRPGATHVTVYSRDVHHRYDHAGDVPPPHLHHGQARHAAKTRDKYERDHDKAYAKQQKKRAKAGKSAGKGNGKGKGKK